MPKQRRFHGCPRCGEQNVMLVSVTLRWLTEDRQSGDLSGSKSLSFCAPCAQDVYEYLRRHLDRARMERVSA